MQIENSPSRGNFSIGNPCDAEQLTLMMDKEGIWW